MRTAKIIRMKPLLKNMNDKSAHVNMFSELFLAEKETFWRYL